MDEGILSPTRLRAGASDFLSHDNCSTGHVPRETLGHRTQFVGKRVIDYLGAALGLLFLWPVLLAVAVAIRLDSKGPVLFRQYRLGRNGREFPMWKFRTMVCDAEDQLGKLERLNESPGGVLFKIRHDPRVTRVGRVLRRTSLDELPQLVNVLQGQMSLVGPRPLPLRDCGRLVEADKVGFLVRHRVLPGLTGPWQVGGRSDVGHEQMIDIDVEYVLNWTLWRDLILIAKSVLVPLCVRGAH